MNDQNPRSRSRSDDQPELEQAGKLNDLSPDELDVEQKLKTLKPVGPSLDWDEFAASLMDHCTIENLPERESDARGLLMPQAIEVSLLKTSQAVSAPARSQLVASWVGGMALGACLMLAASVLWNRHAVQSADGTQLSKNRQATLPDRRSTIEIEQSAIDAVANANAVPVAAGGDSAAGDSAGEPGFEPSEQQIVGERFVGDRFVDDTWQTNLLYPWSYEATRNGTPRLTVGYLVTVRHPRSHEAAHFSVPATPRIRAESNLPSRSPRGSYQLLQELLKTGVF